MGKLRSVSTPVFLVLAVILYILILTTGGTLLVASSFGAIVLILLVEGIAVLVLKEKTDALALISVCYYANLILNIVAAFRQFRRDLVFPIALVLFLLCDTVIGLQVAAGGYLPIGEDSWLHRLIFMDFNLAWFFYLPSQVLIALSSKK